jgi:Right handed beta helix region
MEQVTCWWRMALVFGFALFGGGAWRVLAAAEFHVDPTGDDRHAGTLEAPLATLEAARDAARGLPRGREPITIWLHAGTWARRQGLTLTTADGGTPTAPVRWQAWPGTVPHLRSGIAVPAALLLPVDDARIHSRLDPAVADQVRRIDLAALGITHGGPLPALFADGGGILRLFAGNQPLPMVRWPVASYLKMGKVIEGGSKEHGGIFTYAGDRPGHWQAAVEDGLWVAGFWRVPWVIQTVRVARIDSAAKSITQAVGVPGGIGSKYSKEVNGSRIGSGTEPWYVLNLLEELRLPGQWALDQRTRSVYLIPPAAGDLMLVDDAEPLINVQGASDLSVIGLALSGGLGDALQVTGGERVAILGCTISDCGRDGIVIQGGRDHLVRANEVVGAGSRPIVVSGGDRRTLTGCGHVVRNNHLHHYGTVQLVVPGIQIDGVGVRVERNLIHDGPNSGILYGGNDHLIDGNEIHNIGLGSGDLGAIYAVLDWASRGTVLRHNFIHHIPNGQGIYLDDGKSGDQVLDNTIAQAINGVFLSGGHDQVVRGNRLIDCRKAGIHVDARGIPRKYDANSQGHVRNLHAFNWQQPPWSTHYPELVGILDFHPQLPTGIHLDDNEMINCEAFDLPKKPEERQFITIGSNRAHAAEPVELPLPAYPVGLELDPWRTQLPRDDETGRRSARPSMIVFDSAIDQEASDHGSK